MAEATKEKKQKQSEAPPVRRGHERNADRRNGKAWSKTRFKPETRRGGCAGYSADRIAKMAKAAGLTVFELKEDLRERHAEKVAKRKHRKRLGLLPKNLEDRYNRERKSQNEVLAETLGTSAPKGKGKGKKTSSTK